MKKITPYLFLICFCTTNLMAQVSKTESTPHAGLNGVVTTFKNCLIRKDSIQFFHLFHEEPITWFRIFEESKQQGGKQNDSTKSDYFNENFKDFYRYVSHHGFTDMKLENLEITQDDYIAAIKFDYSFWKGRKKKIWGRESWGLIYKVNHWEIMRVIYSYEFENENPQPKEGSTKVNRQ